MEGTTFGDVPLNAELKLEVWDSPNSAGVMIDAVRCMKLALDHGLSGAVEAPASYFFKSPPTQYTDDEARRATEGFIAKHAREGWSPKENAPGKSGGKKPAKGKSAGK